ncbi:unnamed protein product [Adineta ricciae]|uniref:G-protein coupled receptors family 1 profile domain-containing protein n=1 Tax=Adineta ricciae TaxID=249248 RepID=A0A814GTN7_ADIRI|nr:unnamed protein product [Adineta ricciae]CAF1001221.1 unnamed protein product [Adineta ricciae]
MADPTYFQATRYSQPILIVFGTAGAILNQILFFSRKSLRKNSCSLYFRALSINDLLVIYTVVLPLWLSNQFNIDPSNSYNWYCKLKTYVADSLYTISPYLVVLACFDRMCTSSTNASLRQLATIRVGFYLIPLTVVFIFAAYFHVPIWYRTGYTNNATFCYSPDAIYSRFIGLFVLFFLCIIPPILMVVLCIITLIFLRQQRRRIMPVNQIRTRQRDHQLLKMLFMYVTMNVICNVPFAVTYVMLMFQQPRYVPLHVNLFRLFGLLLNVNFATSFYAYTLGTPFYRHELYNFMISVRHRIRQANYVLCTQRNMNN